MTKTTLTITISFITEGHEEVELTGDQAVTALIAFKKHEPIIYHLTTDNVESTVTVPFEEILKIEVQRGQEEVEVEDTTCNESSPMAEVVVSNYSNSNIIFAYGDTTETLTPNTVITIRVPVGSTYGAPEASVTPTVTGAITYDNDTDTGVINGDGTITFSTRS